MPVTNRKSLRGRSRAGLAAAAAVSAAVVGGRRAGAATLPYTVSITPTVDLTDVYVINDAYSNYGFNIVVNPVAASIPAGTTAVATGSNSFDSGNDPPSSFVAQTATIGVYQNGTTTDPNTGDTVPNYGLSIGYGSANAAGILAAGALGVDTSFGGGGGNSLPAYDPSMAADPDTHGVVFVFLDDSEADVIAGLQAGDTNGAVYTFAQNLIGTFPGEITAANDLTDPSLTLLDFSNATLGGTADVVQTVAGVPEPAALPGAAAAAAAALGGRRPRRSGRRRAV